MTTRFDTNPSPLTIYIDFQKVIAPPRALKGCNGIGLVILMRVLCVAENTTTGFSADAEGPMRASRRCGDRQGASLEGTRPSSSYSRMNQPRQTRRELPALPTSS